MVPDAGRPNPHRFVLTFAFLLLASCSEAPPAAVKVPSCVGIVVPVVPTVADLWARREVPVRAVYFENRKAGWIVDNFGLWRTQDGGRSWREIPGFADYSFRDVYFESASKLWILVQVTEQNNRRVLLLRTTDRGSTWFPATPCLTLEGSFEEPRYLLHFSGQTGLLCSSKSVFYTSDQGRTWSKSNLPQTYVTAHDRSQFSFVSTEHGWFLDKTKVCTLWETKNSGASWVPVYEGDPGEAIQFIDRKTGFAVQSVGVRRPVLFFTNNSGAGWQELGYVPVEPEPFRSELTALPDRTLLLGVGRRIPPGRSFWLSADLGETWSRVREDRDESALAFFLNKSTGWVLQTGKMLDLLAPLRRMRRTVLFTDNGGQDWRALSTFDPDTEAWSHDPNAPTVDSETEN